MVTPLTREEVVAEAWRLRQEINRRLLRLAVEQAHYERMRAALDEEFAGERISPDGRTP